MNTILAFLIYLVSMIILVPGIIYGVYRVFLWESDEEYQIHKLEREQRMANPNTVEF